MGLPTDVIVELAVTEAQDEATEMVGGWTDITDYVNEISGQLRGRSYEIGEAETGSVTLNLDNSDGRFTPERPGSPYYPYIIPSRPIRVRGTNMATDNVATTGGKEHNSKGFFVSEFAPSQGLTSLLDGFSRTAVNGWGSPETGQTWEHVGGDAANYSVSGGLGRIAVTLTDSRRFTYAGEYTDVMITGQVVAPDVAVAGGNLTQGFVTRFTDSANFYQWQINFNTSGTAVLEIGKMVAGVWVNLPFGANIGTVVLGGRINVVIEHVGNKLKAKAWKDGQVEPGVWGISTTDSDILTAGSVGCGAYRATGNTNTTFAARYDNFQATNAEGTLVHPTVEHVAAPAVRGVGTQDFSNPIIPTLPVGWQPDDIFVAAISCAVNVTPLIPSGWEHVPGSPVTDTDVQLNVMWKRAELGDVDPDFGSLSGDGPVARVIAISGCPTSGSPFDAIGTSYDDITSTDVVWPGVTTVTENCLILEIVANDYDPASNGVNLLPMSNANYTGITERMDHQLSGGHGGGLAMVSGVKPYVGATGQSTASFVNAAKKALMTLALKPTGPVPEAGSYVVRCTFPAEATDERWLANWYASADAGTRLTYSAYIWKADASVVPADAQLFFGVNWYDEEGNKINGSLYVEADPEETTPTRYAVSGLPPSDAVYALGTISMTVPQDEDGAGGPVADLPYLMAAYQEEKPQNLHSNPNGNTIEGWSSQNGTFSVLGEGATVTFDGGAGVFSSLSTDVNGLVPGQMYGVAAEVSPGTDCPDLMMSVDDGASGSVLSAVQETSNFDSGTHGVAVAAGGNIDSASGSIYSTAAAVHGSLGVFSDFNDFVRVNNTTGTPTHSGSLYVRIPTDPGSGAARLVGFANSSNTVLANIRANNAGRIQIANGSNAMQVETSVAFAINQVFRIDWQWDAAVAGSQAAPKLTVRVFLDPESDTYDEEISWTASGLASDFSRWVLGALSSTATWTSHIDTLRASAGLVWLSPFATTGWTPLELSFVAESTSVRLQWIATEDTVEGGTFTVRNVMVHKGEVPSLAEFTETGETPWTQPNHVFFGWVERWPTTFSPSGQISELQIVANDRLKKLGDVDLGSVVIEMLQRDGFDTILALTEDQAGVELAGGRIGVQNLGRQAAYLQGGIVLLEHSKNAGAITYTFGVEEGPTAIETAFNQIGATETEGYAFVVPYTTESTAVTLPDDDDPEDPETPTDTPGTHTKVYPATWSRAFDGDGSAWLDFGDHTPYIYQGEVSSTHGRTRSLVGFNDQQIRSDLAGATVVECVFVIKNVHTYWNGGARIYVGTHDYGSKPSSWSSGSVQEQRVSKSHGKSSTVSVDLGTNIGKQLQDGTHKGVAVGPPPNNSNDYYAYYRGATQSDRPYLKITYTIP